MGIESGWATASLVIMCASLGLAILLTIYLWFCYFPGGRNRKDVIDIGELPKYNLTSRPADEEMYEDGATEAEYTPQGTEELYYDQRPKSAMKRDRDPDELPVRRGVQMMEI